MNNDKTTLSTPAQEPMRFVGLRLPGAWLEAVKRHCEEAGFPGSHPTVLRRAIVLGLQALGISIGSKHE